jgi:hypothetical protein
MSDHLLLQALEDYRQKVNSSERVSRMIANWEPHLLLTPSDREIGYYVKFDRAAIGPVTTGKPDADGHLVEIEGQYEELLSIFTGKTNPAQSFLNGNISVYADEKDQVKLDAISLVLWGL